MKTYIVFVLVFAAQLNFAQNVFPLPSGNVGIGTTNPASPLEIVEISGSKPGGVLSATKSILKLSRNGTANYTYNENAEFRIGHGGNSIWGSKLDLYINGGSNQNSVPDQHVMTWNFNGNVGIGTDAPFSKLSIAGSLTLDSGLGNTFTRPVVSAGTMVHGEIRGYSTGGNALDDGFLRLSAGGGTSLGIKSYIDLSGYSTVPDMNSNIVFGTSGVERMRVNVNGNVGIGTSNPSEKLEIYNSDTSPGVLSLRSNRNDLQFVDVGRISAKQGSVEVSRIGMPRSGETSTGYFTFWTKAANSENLTEKVRISENGNMGIGTLNPQNKLDVKGTIHSQEVKVDMLNWSDFVFKKGYNLPTLQEVEKHIAQKGHLENIPSEEEVLKNGINLGEMDARLLQKIEELTLYVIEQEKKNDLQSKELELLKKENQNFQSILDRVIKLENQSK